MKIQNALVPHKHVRFSNSLIGTAGYIRQFISQPTSVDGLWAKIEADNNSLFQLNFTQFIFSLDILLFLGVIVVDENGIIFNMGQQL
ncbi:TPA: hypothetical protein NPQ93_003796 [Acinetobacter baumannii]|nr:hypothetical protein [Acinetobacter baumannii]